MAPLSTKSFLMSLSFGLNFSTKKRQVPRKSFKSFFILEGNNNTIKSTVPREYIETLIATYISSDVKDNTSTLMRYSEILKKVD